MKLTFTLYQRSLYDLSQEISWAEHKRKPYIIRDPANSDELLYLSEGEYNKLVRVVLSTESKLDVVATPRDTPISVNRKFPGSKESTESPFLLGLRFSRDFIFNLQPGWILKESMIEFDRNIKSFFPAYYKSILSWLGHKSSKTNSKLVRIVGQDMETIFKTRGINQVIKRLQVSAIAVMQYLAGTPLNSTQELGLRVKLIHGLPAFLPANLRFLIRTKNITYVRTLLSLLHSYKAFKGKYGEPDLSSITSPRFHFKKDGSDGQMNIPGFSVLEKHSKSLPFNLDIFDSFHELDKYARTFWKIYNKGNIPCKFGIDVETPPLSLTAGTNHRISFVGNAIDALAHMMIGRKGLLLSYIQAVKGEWGPNHFNKPNKFEGLDQFVNLMSNNASFIVKFWQKEGVDIKERIKSLKLGRLAIKLEAAGKIRVFAISDYWTQWICHPLQEQMFLVLKSLSTDATFDQLGAVNSFMNKPHSFIASYDLKSATDLIPQQIYVAALGPWMGPESAQAWVNMLVNRDYHFKEKVYRYTRGQPMGTISSWSGLAIVHHFLVHVAASRINKSSFDDYLVLGDDIVIGDKNVALSYTQVCKDYGITIGFAKSFVSNDGFFQFASQDILGNTNISPISLKEVLSISERDKLDTYSSGITSLGNKCEFASRLIGKGFLDPTNPLSTLRAVMTPKAWKMVAKDLSKGILPHRTQDFLLTMLSSTRFVENNTFSVSQLMAVMYGDINCLTKIKSYGSKEQSEFISELWENINSNVTTKLNSLMSNVSSAQVSNLGGWCVDSHFYSTIINFERSKFLTSLMKLRKEFIAINKVVKADLANNRIVELCELHDRYVNIDFIRINEINKLLSELEALRLEILVFSKVVKLSPTLTSKVPPRVKSFLSLRSYLDRNGKNISFRV